MNYTTEIRLLRNRVDDLAAQALAQRALLRVLLVHALVDRADACSAVLELGAAAAFDVHSEKQASDEQRAAAFQHLAVATDDLGPLLAKASALGLLSAPPVGAA